MAGIFSTLSVARTALQAQDAAIRVTGHNIANAGTEGYSRQRVLQTAAEPERLNALSIGNGVVLSRIERLVDAQVEASLRNAGSSLHDLQTRSRVLGACETILNDLADHGLGPAIAAFYAALNDLAVSPEDHTLRSQVVAAADALSDAFAFAYGRLTDLAAGLDDEVITAAGEINRMAQEIAQLNERIVVAEHGGMHLGTANDLRDRRDLLLQQLAQLTNLRAVETSTGAVNVMIEGAWLVFGREANQLAIEEGARDGVPVHTVRFASDGRLFAPGSGAFGALLAARDTLVPEQMAHVDRLAHTFMDAINRVHTTGEGLARPTALTGTAAVASPTARLDAAGLAFGIQDGRFIINVRNENTGHVDSYDIAVQLAPPHAPMSLADLAAAITAAVAADHPEVSAQVTSDFRLAIRSSSPSLTLGFREDTSGVLAALGIHTFFTGRGAADMGVNDLVRGNLQHLATGYGHGPADNGAVLDMLALRDRQLIDGDALESWWHGRIGALGVARAQARGLAQNQQVIRDNLATQREALSGVNIDEEAINLIKYQRAYQGAARLLSVVDALLATLLNAVS